MQNLFYYCRNRRGCRRTQLRRLAHARVAAPLPRAAEHQSLGQLGNLGAEDLPIRRRGFGAKVDAASTVRRSRSASLWTGDGSDNSRKAVTRRKRSNSSKKL